MFFLLPRDQLPCGRTKRCSVNDCCREINCHVTEPSVVAWMIAAARSTVMWQNQVLQLSGHCEIDYLAVEPSVTASLWAVARSTPVRRNQAVRRCREVRVYYSSLKWKTLLASARPVKEIDRYWVGRGRNPQEVDRGNLYKSAGKKKFEWEIRQLREPWGVEQRASLSDYCKNECTNDAEWYGMTPIK